MCISLDFVVGVTIKFKEQYLNVWMGPSGPVYSLSNTLKNENNYINEVVWSQNEVKTVSNLPKQYK
jgi:hypothetical protein